MLLPVFAWNKTQQSFPNCFTKIILAAPGSSLAKNDQKKGENRLLSSIIIKNYPFSNSFKNLQNYWYSPNIIWFLKDWSEQSVWGSPCLRLPTGLANEYSIFSQRKSIKSTDSNQAIIVGLDFNLLVRLPRRNCIP